MAARFSVIAIAAMLAGAGCGGGEDTTSPSGSGAAGATGATAGGSTGSGTTGGGTGGSTPVGETITLTLESFDVQPGTERQVCKIVNLPADVDFDVVRFRSVMGNNSHHFNAYKVLTDPTARVTGGDGGGHDCAPASEQLAGDAAYIFGAATPERVVDVPAGVSFHLLAQQRIILEQHVINASGAVIQGGSTFELSRPTDGTSIEHHADIMWMANWGFYLLPNKESSFTTHCDVPYAVELFGLMSHTHALGTHFSIEKWTESSTTHLYDSTDWQHPPYEEYAPPVALAAGEGLEWTCTWNNVTPNAVGPGKNSTDEMCITFGYAYPTDTLDADPIQCN